MAPTISLEMPSTLDAPAMARDALVRVEESVPGHVMPDLKLLVSELVTNSVKYGGGGPVRFELESSPEWIRGEIVDEGSGFTPTPRDGDTARVGGWGLHLVEQMTDDWGTYMGSTHVWFEIDPRKPRPHQLAA